MIRYLLISFMLASSALGVTPGDYWIQQFNNAGTKNIQIDLGAGGNNQVPFQDGSGTWGTGALPNANLAHSSITINGITISLGSSGTITATSTGTLTIGTHLTGGSYNGSAGITIATDAASANTVSTIVARDGSGNFSAGTITAALSGNASTATALQNARTIGGVSFDGTSNITVASATGGFTISGGDLALGANNLTMTGSLGATGARVTKGWFTDLQVTNAIAGSITGNAATVTTNANLTGPITSVGNATAISNSVVTEAMQTLSDVTTANVSISTHGYAPKAPSDATKFLNGANPPAWTVPVGTVYTNGTGLGLTGNTFSVNTSQSITILSNLTTNGFVKTTGGTGTLAIDTNTYLTGNQSITLSGDVTGSGTTAITTTLANIPTATPAVGTILHTNIAAPSSPSSGKVAVYSDSTDLRFHDKNASGVIGTTVVSDTGATHNFLTAVSAAGVISKAQPAFTDVSGSVAATQMPALTGDVTTSAGAVATTLATVNSNVGSFTSANITVNAKGLVTAAANGSGGAVSGTLVWISTVQMKGTMSTSSTSFTDITDGTSPLTITYTPTSSSDKFIIVVSLSTEGTSSNAIAVRLIRDSTPIDIGDAAGSRIQATAESYSSNGDHAMYVAPHYLDSPGDTSSHTWKVQIECSSAGTAVVNRGSTDANSSSNARTASTMTLYKVTP